LDAVSRTRIIGNSQSYGQFLGAGDCFTAFAGALNAGLPVMFDREFGFEPLAGGSAGIPIFDCVSLSDFIVSQSLLQAAVIVTAGVFWGLG